MSLCINFFEHRSYGLGFPLKGFTCRAGIGGSALEAEVNRTDVPAWYCDRKTNGYRLLFLALNEAARPACFVDELLVSYDAHTGRYVHAPVLEHSVEEEIRISSNSFGTSICKHVIHSQPSRCSALQVQEPDRRPDQAPGLGRVAGTQGA